VKESQMRKICGFYADMPTAKLVLGEETLIYPFCLGK
jgi:hypothetical protein